MDTRADLLSASNVRLLRSAGFRYFRVGLETLDPTLLGRVAKGWSPAQAIECLRSIREETPDVAVHAYWITGLPGSTAETMRQSLADVETLLEQNLIDILSNKVLVPYPGTVYHSQPGSSGLHLLKAPWAAYDRLSPPVYELDRSSSAEIYDWFCLTERLAGRVLRRRLSKIDTSTAGAARETYKAVAYLGSRAPSPAALPLVPTTEAASVAVRDGLVGGPNGPGE
jgi:radical SAM superfamily enzyme YgiQ (UPF0313 family)